VAGAEDDVKMPLMEHLTELRTRLLYSLVGFVLVFFLSFGLLFQPVLDLVTAPLEAACLAQGKPCPVIYTSLIEPFFTQVKIAAFAAICITFPLIASQIYKFVAPGLYKTERMALLPFLVATPIMFAIGASFVYFVLLPLALHFFTGYQDYVGIELMPKIGEYIDLVMKLVLAFGLCFELPVVLTLLAKGLTVKRVAELLEISPNTTAGYVKDVYRKLNVSSRAEATLEAARRGLIELR